MSADTPIPGPDLQREPALRDTILGRGIADLARGVSRLLRRITLRTM